MTEEEHKKIHVELHDSLDKLVADMVRETDKTLSGTTVMELIEWSHKQTIKPTVEE